MNVSFDPNLVSEYRLIGFDNKRSALADTSLNLEGGEVGSGHSLMAIFEIVPSNRNINFKDEELKNKSIASVNLHYRLPGKKESKYFNYKCPFQFQEFEEEDPYIRFATSVAMFGSLLRDCKYIKKSGWDELLVLTKNSIDETDPLEKEFYDLVTRAKKIYTAGVGKKKKKGE
jgi:Ca-activated chloride channel family protein